MCQVQLLVAPHYTPQTSKYESQKKTYESQKKTYESLQNVLYDLLYTILGPAFGTGFP
jgi:hypothetical protein